MQDFNLFFKDTFHRANGWIMNDSLVTSKQQNKRQSIHKRLDQLVIQSVCRRMNTTTATYSSQVTQPGGHLSF